MNIHKLFNLVMALIFAVSLTGSPAPVFAQEPLPHKVGLITDESGIDDMGFNWLAYQGLLQAESNLGVDGTLYQVSGSNHAALLQQCVDDGNELCIAVGYFFGASLAGIARANPDTKWGIVDYTYPDCWEGAVEGVDCGSFTEVPNVRGIKFDEKQVGYLAGALAGKMTTSNVIGTIGGMDIPPVTAFMDGYRNGAQCANANVNVLMNFTGTFIDPELGAAVAEDMMQDGADVIFGVAGPTGNGAILYSSQHEVWSIGIDTDQYLSVFGNGTVDGSDKLLTSAMKNLDNGVYQTIEDYINGGFSSGTVTYHLTDGGVGLAPYHETDDDISLGVKDYVDGVKADIINGSININEPCRTAIYGTLKDSAGDPIHNAIQVRAVKVSDGSEAGRTQSHSLDGTYSLVDLPLDEPLVVVASDEDPDVDGYALRYYNDVSEISWAENITLTSISPMRADVDLRLSGGGTAVEHLTFNVNAGRLLSDVAIRKAIAYGTEREAILKDAFIANGDTGEVVNNLVLPGMWYEASVVDPLLTVYDFNPPAARDLLTAAGWTDLDADGIRENAMNEELTLDFVTTSIVKRVTSANMFKSQMADIGINVNVTTYTGVDFFSGDPALSPLYSGDFDIAEFAWIIYDDDTLLSIHHSGDLQNLGGYSNTILDGYLDDAKSAKVAGSSVEFKENALNWQYESSDDLPALPMFTRVSSSVPVNSPNFQVRANYDQVEAWDWPLNSELTVRVYVSGTETPTADYTSDPATVTGPAPWGDPRNYVSFDLYNKFDIQPGSLVTVTNADGTLRKETIVTTLAFDVMDADTDTVTGFAPANANVDIWACDNQGNCTNRHVVASDPDGTWIANWGVWGPYPGEENTFDIVPGTWVDSIQNDNDGDGTMFGLSLPNPSIGVRANDDKVEGWQWTVDSIVTVTVDDPNTLAEPDVTRAVQVYEASWNPGEYRFDLNLSGVIDIQPGFVVRAVQGDVTKTLVVSPLAFTGMDINLDLVTGDAEPNSRVDVWTCDNSNCINRHVNADDGGHWTADFAHFGDEGDEQNTFDIVPGTWVDSSQGDEDGDSTMFGQNFPNPRVEVSYEHDWIQIRDFTRGGEVTYTIYDHQGGHALFGPVTGPVDSHGDGWISHNLHHTDLIPGNYITAVNEATSEEVSILIRDVNLDYIGVDDDRAYGTAEPNTTIELHISETQNQGFNLTAEVSSSGYWEVDLAAAGHPIDSYRYANANLYDAEGDSIIAQSAWIDSQVSTDSFGVTNFSKNADVTLTLYDAPGGTILYGPVIQRTEGSGNTWVNLWDYGIDLVPGNYIVAYDHTLNFTKSLEVEPFDFMELNAADDTVAGTAAAGEWVDLHVESLFSNWGQNALTDQSGQWFHDYGAENYNITDQMWANGWAVDERGNRSHDHTTGLPGIEASLADDWISGFNFSPDRQVRVRIYSSEGGSLLADVSINAWGNTQLNINYWQHGVDLQAGMYILAEDLETGKYAELTLAHLTFDGVDYDTNLAWGRAEPFSRVVIRANHLFDKFELTVDTDEFGEWFADFSSYGVSLNSDWDLRAMIYDLELDATVAQVPQPPVFTASLDGDWINGNNWTPNNNVSIRIYEAEGGASIGDTFTWGTDNYGNFNANLGNEGIDIQPGSYITVTDNYSGVVKTLSLPNLTIDYLDPVNDVAGGSAPADTRLSVDFNNQQENIQFDLFSESDGTWEADFAAHDFDLQPGSSGNVRTSDADGDVIQVNGYIFNPIINVRANDDRVEGWQWAAGATVTIEVSRAGESITRSAVVSPHAPWDSNSDPYFEYNFTQDPDRFDIQPGDVVTITEGITIKTMTVSPLTFTNVGLDTDIVTGVANPNADVNIWVCNNSDCNYNRHTKADSLGNWEVDFGNPGTRPDEQTTVDIRGGTWIDSSESDADGNSTMYGINVPNPTLTAFPENEAVEAWEWPDGTTVHLTIDDPATPQSPDLTREGVMAVTTWGDPRTYIRFDFAEEYNLEVGDIVTVTDGTTSRTHVVLNLSVTTANETTETITGQASPGSVVIVWPHEFGEATTETTTEADGIWQVDFTGRFDLVAGAGGRSQILDQAGNATAVDWYVKNPFLITFPENEAVEAWEWPDGMTVYLSIDDPATSQSPDLTREGVMAVTTWGDPRTYIRFDFAEEYNLKVGDIVTVTDGTIVRTHVVLNLSVTAANETTDTITGQANPGSVVIVWPHGYDQFATVQATTGVDGTWLANLTGLHDLVAGTGGRSQILDEAGNSTAVDWSVPFNQPPVAEAGGPYIVDWGEIFTLDGSGSTDPENNIISYEWDLDEDGQYDDASGVTVTTSFSQFGGHIIGLRVTDEGGLINTDTAIVEVLFWTLRGFYQPVDMNGVYNIVKNGSTVPLKFEIFAGNTELTDTAYIKSLTYAQTSCDATAITDEIETIATGSTSLRYDTTTGQFIYNWKTPKTAGKCYRVTMTTIDGSSLVAYFKLK
ncbi:MAG: BMP family ABC transporter substrate-binding protein [Chloroflexi bacterium]|nr:BMP family ABC transporter substrate-binding protein [Chloroflexota bacterium]